MHICLMQYLLAAVVRKAPLEAGRSFNFIIYMGSLLINHTHSISFPFPFISIHRLSKATSYFALAVWFHLQVRLIVHCTWFVLLNAHRHPPLFCEYYFYVSITFMDILWYHIDYACRSNQQLCCSRPYAHMTCSREQSWCAGSARRIVSGVLILFCWTAPIYPPICEYHLVLISCDVLYWLHVQV